MDREGSVCCYDPGPPPLRPGPTMRRLATFLVVTVATAVATLYWLHDGDLRAAAEPVVAEWNTAVLLQDAGLEGLPGLPPVAVDPPSNELPAEQAAE